MATVVVNRGAFVRSTSNALGVGKLKTGGAAPVIEYFVGPGCTPVTEQVAPSTVRAVTLESETRVYQQLPDGVSWRAGRALTSHFADYVVRFPNSQKPELVPAVELFTRCELPRPEPHVFLAARITETPHWQERRAGFVQAVVEQRRACAGLTGLLSSVIDLEPHQVEVVRRVLQDPAQRYLLADEVGLGKTIEAGVIIRQYVLDRPTDHRILILVPGHLVRQWEAELTNRFRLGPFLGRSVRVLPHDSDLSKDEAAGLVVVDEAHQLARWVGEPARSPARKRFEAIRTLVTDPRTGLLLLSATPTLHSDETGFQALLHLLDPVVYPLGDLEGFRERLGTHERVAQLYHLFRPDEEGGYLETALDQLLEAFPKDARLKELGKTLRPMLAYGKKADDPRRVEAVRAVRSHVSEAYRLHRRLLRNRRADDRVAGLLPGRLGLTRWTYDDPELPPLVALLDAWRKAAAAAVKKHAEFGRLYALFAEALACDPEVLAAFVGVRLGEEATLRLTAADQRLLAELPHFPGEEKLLTKLQDAAGDADPTPRIAAVVAGLDRAFALPKTQVTRAVIFASQPAAADAVYDAAAKRWPGQTLRHGVPGWQHFLTSQTFRVLVCDAAAEEGLNLHGRGTVLVHYDLPWSPNRVEQRVGRLDRFGVATPVRSVVPVAAGDPLAAAVADYLELGYRVFERSVAALQYVTEEELAALHPAALAEGAAAVAAATARLGGDEGVVETTLRDIQVLDELDAVEAPPGHEGFADALREADATKAADWQAAMHTWVGETLQFARRGEGGADTGVWRYQFRRPIGEGGPATLMPTGRLVRHFAHILDTDDERSTPTAPLTYAITFDRVRAQRERVALARVGDPFTTSLVDYVGWDDRGAVAAMWRYRPKGRYAKPAEVAFRFEFVVECPTDAAVEALPKGGSVPAVRRQADWVFPPFVLSVWLDQDLEVIADGAAKAAVLAEPYEKRKRPDGGRDFNLNADRWTALLPHFPRAAWAKTVEKARKAAEAAVRKSARWKDEVSARSSAARRAAADRDAQTASRLAFLTGPQKKAEKAHAAAEKAMADALLRGVEKPAVRLDAAGAVFLASWNPFDDADE
ncbi:MAG TPA: protein DpdE [Urbifossiella sp.]|nr:protein DpdE [Urbifossiella sp.]